MDGMEPVQGGEDGVPQDPTMPMPEPDSLPIGGSEEYAQIADDFQGDMSLNPPAEPEPDAGAGGMEDMGFDTTSMPAFDATPDPNAGAAPEDVAPMSAAAPSAFDDSLPVPAESILPPPAPEAGMPDMGLSFMDKREEFNAKWALELDEKDKEEETKRQELKDSAERWLDQYHDDQTDARLAKMEANRKTEKDNVERMEELLEEATKQNPFKRVFELIGENQSARETETERMFSLLVNLKARGKTQA